MGLFGKKTKYRVVDVMLSMMVHPSNVLLEGPANIKNWSERALRDERPKWRLAPDAKTGFIMAPGRSVDQVKNDLPEQMQKFMKMNGLDPKLYETECFTDHLGRDNIKCVFMTASKKANKTGTPGSKQSPSTSDKAGTPESIQQPAISDAEDGFFQYPMDLIPKQAGYCSDPQCPCPETEIPRGSGWLFISNDAVTFLKAAKKDPSLLNSPGNPVPILICKKAATLRSLDLVVSAADAKRWWETGKVPLRATPTSVWQEKVNKFQESQLIRKQVQKLKADIEKQMNILSYIVNGSEFGKFNRQNVETYFDMDREMASSYSEETRRKMLEADKYFAPKPYADGSVMSGYEQVRLILIDSQSGLLKKFVEIYADILPYFPPGEAEAHITYLKEISTKLTGIKKSINE